MSKNYAPILTTRKKKQTEPVETVIKHLGLYLFSENNSVVIERSSSVEEK